MSGSGCSTALLVGLWAARCGLWALNVPVDVDATAPRALLLHFFMHSFVLASQREGGTGVRVWVCVSVYICTCVSGSGDVDRRLCAVAVASAVKLCVSNVLCLQQSFTPIILLPLSTAMLPLHWFTQTHTGTRSKSLKQANGNGSGLHVMLVEVPAMVSLLFYHKHLRPDLTWLCAACERVPHTAAFYYTCNMGHDAMSSCLAPRFHLPPPSRTPSNAGSPCKLVKS